jgi:hypothetical protein
MRVEMTMGKKKLSPTQMYNELVSKGFVVVATSPFQYVLPTAYHYIPTNITYAPMVGTHAELEPSSAGNKEAAGQWVNFG